MVQTVIKPQQARYILKRQDLLEFLKEKFSNYPDYDFKILVHTENSVRAKCH